MSAFGVRVMSVIRHNSSPESAFYDHFTGYLKTDYFAKFSYTFYALRPIKATNGKKNRNEMPSITTGDPKGTMGKLKKQLRKYRRIFVSL